MIRIRRRISGYLTISALAVIAALAGALFGFSTAQAHTTTAALLPNGQGTYAAWTGDEDGIDEADPVSCAGSDRVQESTAGNRESVLINLAGVPNGATITTVDIQSWHVGQGGTGGTYQTFARIGGVDTDSGTNIATTSSSGCTAAAAQSINVADTVKSGSTVLEIGVVKTAADTNAVRVGALRAIVNYNRAPSTPSLLTPADGATTADKTPTFDWNDSSDPDGSDGIAYQIARVPQVSGICDWGSATIDVVSSSTFTPGPDMSLGTHCWRVRAVDHAGLASSYGSERTLTIKASVNAVITAADKDYDGTTDAGYTCEVTGEDSGDTVTCDGTHPATFDDKNVGTEKTVTATGLSLGGADAGSYVLTNTSDTDTADISKATLSVDAVGQSKDYGDDDPTLTYTLDGFVDGETALTAAGFGGAGACTRDAGETVTDSPYEINCTPGTLTATNYSFAAGDTADLTIDKADPVCSIDGYSGTYDGDAHGATGSCEGVDDEGELAGLNLGDSFTNVPGGTAQWTFTDETGNYNDDSGTAEIVINAATLTVDADDTTKDYGDDDPELSYDLSGFVDGEDEVSAGVTGEAACERVEGETVAGSPYIITCEPGTLTADNYIFEAGTIGNLTIEAAEVSAEITAADKDYDGNEDAEYTCDVVGAESGDDVTCDGNHPGSFDTETAGIDKTVAVSGLVLSGDDAGNYSLSNTTDTDQADITKVTLSVDADDNSKTYGESDPTLTYTLTGFVAGEDASNADGLTGAASCTRDSGETVADGPYEITCTTGDLVADNYDFETGETGDFSIDQATLSVDADDKSKTFGDDDPVLTYTLSGFAAGEDEASAGVDGDASCSRADGETVAGSPYDITCAPGTLTADNYTFETGDVGELTIEGAEVTAEITAENKVYDGLVDAVYTCDVVGEASGDDVTCDGDHPATFDDAGAGTDKTVTATNLVLSGDDAGNYTLTNGTDTDEADITKATLSVDADDASKSFGDDDPTFTYTLSGFVAPDDELTSGITGAGECTRAPGETVAGSPYTITCTPDTLAADNYDFQAGDTGEFTINPDTTVPSVTIEQALSQDDPTSDSPIVFDVEFSESVTGFEDEDVDLSGTAGATTAEVSGEGAEYTVSVSGMTGSGTVIADVKAAAATDGSNDSTASTSEDNTVEYVAPITDFDPGPTATISGTPRVGDTLTAGEGSPSPEPDDFEYQWFADGNPISGATNKTFTPTAAQVGKALTVEVTAVKAGFTDASDLSDPTSPVGTLAAKNLSINAGPGAFAGDRIAIGVARLAPREAYTIRFNGDVIAEGKASSFGTDSITWLIPLSVQPGNHTVTVVGSLPDRTGTDTQLVRDPSSLGVTLTKPSVAAGGTQRVQVKQLLNGEKVEVRYDGTLVSPSSAEGNSLGGYSLSFPVGSTVGSHSVEVTGTYNGRTATKTFNVTGP